MRKWSGDVDLLPKIRVPVVQSTPGVYTLGSPPYFRGRQA
jgi:hypothetical protein